MKKIAILMLSILFLLSACEKFLDINDDPNNPTEPKINQLLPAIIYDMADDLSYSFGKLGYICAVYTHQLVSRENIDQYNVNGFDYGIQNFWQDLYSGPLMDLRVLIELGEESDNLAYAGIAKVLKAHIYSVMVDLWGDIPFSEATTPGIIHPVFDDDEAIYTNLLLLLDEAIADLENPDAENSILPGDDDIIYQGDLDSWIMAAKTMKLKLYNNTRLTNMFDQAAVNALISGDLIEEGGDFLVPFGAMTNPDNRHPAFIDEYAGPQISNYISPWFYEIMSGKNQNIFGSIIDPRIPYYWVNQIGEDGETENDPEYRDGGFVTIYFGSTGINRDHAGRATFTMMGIYVCGGKYDDGTYVGGNGGTPLGATAGTGASPQRMLTYADRLFIEAELMQAGHVTGDVRAKLEEAIRAAFAQVDMVVDMVSPAQNVPAISGTTAEDDYVAAVLSRFDAADASKKMEIIITQKWISSFGWSIDPYADYRRTGYPVLFDANSNNGSQDGGPDGSGLVPTQVLRDYPLSLPYDEDELTLNNNAPAQKNITQARVFWDID